MVSTDLINNAFENILQGVENFAFFTIFKRLLKAIINIME